MQTMQPVVLRGLSGLALPVEEFDLRVAAIRRDLAHQALDALVVYGDARDYVPLAWVTGLVPMLRWAIAVVPAASGVELFLAMPGSRDVAAMRKLTVAAAVDGIGALGRSLRRFRRVALAGARHMRASQEAAIRQCVAEAVDGDALIAELAAEPSDREVGLLEQAAAFAEEAARMVEHAWQKGVAAGPALLEGDLLARQLGAHDVRLMWSGDGGVTFRPLTRPASQRPHPFAFYLAVEHGGYWGEAFRTLGAPADEPAAPHPTVAGAARMWLSIEETSERPSRPGVYSIRAATVTGAVSSRTVRVR
jgi:hypothetical protein